MQSSRNIYNSTPETEDVLSCARTSVFDYMKTRAEKFSDRPAYNFYGISFTYKDLFKNIDETARALVAMGVKKGDVVIVSLPAIPEAVYLFYATNKIGAIYCGMDCRIAENEIKEIISQINPKLCIVSDFHLKEFRNVKNIPVVFVPPANSIKGFAAFGQIFADFFKGRTALRLKNKNILTYTNFNKKAALVEKAEEPKANGDEICAYFFTSGTTYGQKCVVLSNFNINSAMYQLMQAEEYTPGDRFCSTMPLFTCYGIMLGVNLPLINGLELRLIPLFKPEKLIKILTANKASYVITVPSHWEHFINGNFESCDLSAFKGLFVGGDKLFEEEHNKILAILRKCNSNGRIIHGYALTETVATGAYPRPGTPLSSVGKSTSLVELAVFDPDTLEEMPAGKQGEICFRGPNICLGYLNDQEATDRLIKTHSDGRTWLHSGDIGYIDEEGYVYFCERIKRMYVRHDGTKISPFSIEQTLNKCSVISKSLVVPVDDKEHLYGKIAKALIVLKEDADIKSADSVIKKYIHSDLPEHLRPAEFRIVERLPLAKSGKTDYFAAHKMFE